MLPRAERICLAPSFVQIEHHELPMSGLLSEKCQEEMASAGHGHFQPEQDPRAATAK